MNTNDILLILFILLLLNAFFSTAEFSIASSRKLKLQQLSSSGNKSADLVISLIESPTTFITGLKNVKFIFLEGVAMGMKEDELDKIFKEQIG